MHHMTYLSNLSVKQQLSLPFYTLASTDSPQWESLQEQKLWMFQRCFLLSFVGRMSYHKPIDLEKVSHETLGNIHPLFDSSLYQIYPGTGLPGKKNIVFGRRCQQGLLQASWWWSTIPPKKTQRKAGIWKSEVLMKIMKWRFWNWKLSFVWFILMVYLSFFFWVVSQDFRLGKVHAECVPKWFYRSWSVKKVYIKFCRCFLF